MVDHKLNGRVFTTAFVSLNISEIGLLADFVKLLKKEKMFSQVTLNKERTRAAGGIETRNSTPAVFLI